MNEIFFPEVRNAKKIRMRCPYCGQWHNMEWEQNVLVMKCDPLKDVWDNQPNVKIEVEQYKDEIYDLMIKMKYPCWYVEEEVVEKTIDILDCEISKDLEKITIRKEEQLKSVDEVIYESSSIDSYRWSGYRESVAKGCNGSSHKKSCRMCCHSAAYYKRDNIYAMHITIELEFYYLENKGKEKIQLEKSKNKEEQKILESKKGGKKFMTMLPMEINKIAKDFGINFGINTDDRIKSTILGTVVEYKTGKFRGFDRNTKQMTEYSDLATISLPSILVPSTTVKVGDTIIHNGEPFFIGSVEENDIWGANPLTAKEEKVLPIMNPLGVKTYTRLISIGEIMGFKGNNPQNTKIVMWILTMMANKVCSDGVDSANEKIKEVTEKGEKYLEVLAPFACVAFAAYVMKGEDMRLDNLSKTAKDAFGVDLECLKNKNNLKRIAAIGVATTAAIAYFNGTVKQAASNEEQNEYNEEEVTKGLDKLLKAIKPWEGTIKKVLPAAIAICALKIFNGEDKIEDIKAKMEGIVLIAKDKFCEKLGIDESIINQENLKKMAALVGIAVAVFMMYGKKINNKDKNTEEANGMIKQIVPVIAPLIPAVIIFAPKLKSFFEKNSDFDISEFVDDFSEEVDEKEMSADTEEENEEVPVEAEEEKKEEENPKNEI